MSVTVGPEQVDSNYYFKWDDYQNHLTEVARQLLENDSLVDVTLIAERERIPAHRIVLSACSTLFQEILSQVTEDHPTIIISDISAQDVRSIVEFTYHGEVRIPVENINNLLDAAHSLRIIGLMDIDGLDESDTGIHCKDLNQEGIESFVQLNDMEDTVLQELSQEYDSDKIILTEGQVESEGDSTLSPSKKRKRRRDSNKRDYSEEMLVSAINDLWAGQTLIEAATKNNIPRSTLYMRAKTLGIHLNASRNEYPPECIKAAIDAVMGGSSLQQASENYRIPKTVLWRRIQKEGYHVFRSDMKRTYCTEKREAAVQALARGENLTKVALEFKIPKTTLFRDKARLVDEGKLPLSFWKKRKTESEELKKSRLEEAVAACKDGHMSQATASQVYRVPKTTIWRRLQREGKKYDRSVTGRKQPKQVILSSPEKDTKMENNEGDFDAYCEMPTEIPITYIDGSSIPEDSVIILTTDDVEGLNLEDGRSIVVNSDPGQEFISCGISLGDGTTFCPPKS